jgi:hypothetical protein
MAAISNTSFSTFPGRGFDVMCGARPVGLELNHVRWVVEGALADQYREGVFGGAILGGQTVFVYLETPPRGAMVEVQRHRDATFDLVCRPFGDVGEHFVDHIVCCVGEGVVAHRHNAVEGVGQAGGRACDSRVIHRRRAGEVGQKEARPGVPV